MAGTQHPDARIFTVQTRFQKLALRPGGRPPEDAVARAQENIDALKLEFGNWLENKLQEVARALGDLDAHRDDVARLADAHRGCSQLRDVGATMGFELVSTVADSLCALLDAIEAGALYRKDSIECHIKALHLASKPPDCALPPDQIAEMVGGLRRLVERANGTPTRQAEPQSEADPKATGTGGN